MTNLLSTYTPDYATLPHLTRAANKRAYEQLSECYPEYAEALRLDIEDGVKLDVAVQRITELFDNDGWHKWLCKTAAHLAAQRMEQSQ